MDEDARTPGDAVRREQKSIYVLLTLVTLAIAAGRIATITSREGDTAFLSANDRSRWCTVAALVEDGSYEIDRLLKLRSERGRRPWYTIDLVRHRGADGELHYYSSKPPLFPTMVAGVYAAVNSVTGMTLTDQPIYVTRIVLALVNLPLLCLWLLAMVGVVSRLDVGDWGRRFLVAVSCFATLLLPFSFSLNNHLPAAAATAAVLWIFLAAGDNLRGDAPGGISQFLWFAAGLLAAFAAANELPALSMLGLWGLLLLFLDRRGVLMFSAGVLVVAAAFWGTNWWAHQSWKPPYAHRGNGQVIARLDLQTAASHEVTAPPVRNELTSTLRKQGAIGADVQLQIRASAEPGRWQIVTSDRKLLALLAPPGQAASGNRGRWSVAEWDDWYEYPGSYWQDGKRRGVDRGEPSRGDYLLHMTFGHHGLFSLTPVWLLVPFGLVAQLRTGWPDRRRLTAAILVATSVCVVFYLGRPEIDRNYGGVNIGFRWLLWFAPLWIFACAAPTRFLAQSAAGRGLLWALFGWSVFSVAASLETPWQHPWIYRFWSFLGWIAG